MPACKLLRNVLRYIADEQYRHAGDKVGLGSGIIETHWGYALAGEQIKKPGEPPLRASKSSMDLFLHPIRGGDWLRKDATPWSGGMWVFI